MFRCRGPNYESGIAEIRREPLIVAWFCNVLVFEYFWSVLICFNMF